MKNYFLFFLTIGILMSCKDLTQNKTYNYSGDNWSKYNNHKLQISVQDTVVGGIKIISEQIIKDGKFNVSGDIEYIRNAYFGLYNPDDQFVYKKEFILEPGNLDFKLIEGAEKAKVTGGKYNDLIYNFNGSTEYLSKIKALSDFTKSHKQEDYQNKEVLNEYIEIKSDLESYKFQKYLSILENNPDHIAKVLTLHHVSFLTLINKKLSYDVTDMLNSLERMLTIDNPEIYMMRNREKNKKEQEQNIETVGIGSAIKNFSAKDLNDTEFELTDVLSKNKYVLVEFWASWCAPCRVEIPHMKEAYEKHKDNGFEIVSFTLDHKKERWIKASEQENLPWINVGDLKAHKSPIVKMYGVNGVPANFLVDNSGKIIAKDLRQKN